MESKNKSKNISGIPVEGISFAKSLFTSQSVPKIEFDRCTGCVQCFTKESRIMSINQHHTHNYFLLHSKLRS